METKKQTLGTFGGVFAPSVLTILGIILFRRLSFVVGSAGLGWTLAIIALASLIAILTSISLAAIATNFRVGGGGPYYLISRTLGVEFGGAIGAVLFLAQSISIAFYCIGFAETAVAMLGLPGEVWQKLVAALAVVFLFIFAWLGADWATRLQYVVMAVLGIALLSFFVGGAEHFSEATLEANWSISGETKFWLLFAIFFPAITGFTQGVSMSGDLRDPGRSIQLGTFLAVGTSIVIYLAAAYVLAATLPGSTLRLDYGAMKEVALWSWLVDAGVIAATLSSAMASFLGAPRILQSLALDRIFPFLLHFAQGVGPMENPRRGVLLSGLIALATVFLGNLNFIAPIITMFFLISYGLLNYATFYEARASSPSFRPRFRWFDYRLSLLGALGCGAVMVAIDVTATVVAVSVLFAIYQYLQRTSGPARWADSRRSYHFQRIRENLLEMGQPVHPRDWRPCILVLCDEAQERERMLRFSEWIEGGSGLTTAVEILEDGDSRTLLQREKEEKELERRIAEQGFTAFARVITAPDLRSGLQSLVQCFGVGAIRANIVLFNKQRLAPDVHDGAIGIPSASTRVQEAIRLGCNVLVLDVSEDKWASIEEIRKQNSRIDVWWWGDKTSQLMLLLAYLMTRGEFWHDAQICVVGHSSRDALQKTEASLQATLEDVRIDAEVKVVTKMSPESVLEHSSNAALVFFPLYYREWGIFESAEENFEPLFERLPIVGWALAADDIALEAGPDEGEIAEKTAILDKAHDLAEAARVAEAEADVLRKKVDDAVAAMAQAEPTDQDRDHLQELRETARTAANLAQEQRTEAEAAAKEAETGEEESEKNNG
jgi:amino acid transporter